MKRRPNAPVALALGVLFVSGCRGDAQSRGEDPGDGKAPGAIDVDPPVAESEAAPDTAEGFLHRLIPLPSPQIEVRYAVEGPAGLEGELVLWVKPGGWRHEAWTLRVPMPGGGPDDAPPVVTQVRGLSVQTPQEVWTAVGDESGTITPNRIHDLAQAYLALETRERADVIAALDSWYGRLDAARADAPGDTEIVAGLQCLQTRVAAQNVCLWEAAGLPLTYEGSEFSLRATAVDRSPDLPDDAFELPPRAAEAKAVEPPSSMDFEAEAVVKQLADGDYAPLALVLTPGFRVPSASADP